MSIIKYINDERFNVFFSVMLGIGIVAIFRPICSGAECTVSKPPKEDDFDKFVYRMGGKCQEFKTDIVECPPSGAIEAFRPEAFRPEAFRPARRNSVIYTCD